MGYRYSQISGVCGESAEAGCEEDADVSNVDGEVEEVEDVVDDTTGGH